MKKTVRNALLDYAFEALASELESYRVQVDYKGRLWYDTQKGDCDKQFIACMSLAESLGDEWPYVVIWAKARRFFRVIPR